MDLLTKMMAQIDKELGTSPARSDFELGVSKAEGEMRSEVDALAAILRTDQVAGHFDAQAMALRLWVRGVGVRR